VTSLDGRSYLDFVSDYSAGLYGHSDPTIKQAVADALSLGFSLGGVIEREAELGLVIKKRFPSIERVRFCNSGTEANTYALATALAFTSRRKVCIDSALESAEYFHTSSPVAISLGVNIAEILTWPGFSL
jgi:glutamate-1-semialdehyde 2,1-aminomutase